MDDKRKPRETVEDYKDLCETYLKGIKNLTSLLRHRDKEIRELNREVSHLYSLLKVKKGN